VGVLRTGAAGLRDTSDTTEPATADTAFHEPGRVPGLLT
jgi:hypothetical protein